MGVALDIKDVAEVHGRKFGHKVLDEVVSGLLFAAGSIGRINKTFSVSAAQSVVECILALLLSEGHDLNAGLDRAHLSDKLLS
jgi:hypothetical protein